MHELQHYNSGYTSGQGEQHSSGSNHSSSEGKNWSEGEETGNSLSQGISGSRSNGGDRGRSDSRGIAFSDSTCLTDTDSLTESENLGIANGTSHTVHNKKTFLPVHEDVQEETGRMRWSERDQVAFGKKLITTLGCRQFIIRKGSGRSELVIVDEIELAFEGFPKLLDFHVKKLEQEIRSRHSCYFEAAEWTGKKETSCSGGSSKVTRPQSTNGLPSDGSPIERLLADVQQSLQKESEEESGT